MILFEELLRSISVPLNRQFRRMDNSINGLVVARPSWLISTDKIIVLLFIVPLLWLCTLINPTLAQNRGMCSSIGSDCGSGCACPFQSQCMRFYSNLLSLSETNPRINRCACNNNTHDEIVFNDGKTSRCCPRCPYGQAPVSSPTKTQTIVYECPHCVSK